MQARPHAPDITSPNATSDAASLKSVSATIGELFNLRRTIWKKKTYSTPSGKPLN